MGGLWSLVCPPCRWVFFFGFFFVFLNPFLSVLIGVSEARISPVHGWTNGQGLLCFILSEKLEPFFSGDKFNTKEEEEEEENLRRNLNL